MPTLVLATGFEHGTTAGLATGNVGRRYADSVSTPSISTTTPKNGTYCLRLTATSAIRNLTWDSNTIGASQAHLVAGFWLRFPTSLPAGDVVIAAVQSNSTHDAILFYRTSGTKLTVQLDGTNDVGSFTVVADTWYWIDLHADFTGATSTFDWSVNGTAQTQATVSQTTTVFTFLLGWAASTTATVDYDDVVASVTGADYPLGQHQVVLLKPDTGGTATESGTANATSTFTANGTVGTTFNSANLLSRTSEVPPTIGSTADGFAQRTAGATNWANIPMTSYTLQTGESVSGLRAEVVGWSASALANNIGFRAFNGTTEETFFAAADPNFDNSTTTPAWICEMLTLANYDTQTELDALILRAGFSTDVSPVPGAHALYVEVAVKLAAGATPITLNDSGAASDSLDVSAAAPLADVGGGTDTTAVTATVPLGDSGTAADSISVSIPIPLADSGTAADTITVTAAVPLADVGGGSDSLAVAAQIPLADTGVAADSISVGIPKPLAEVGVAVDTVTTTATVPLAEVGVAADAMAVVAAIPLADTGVASDSISVAQIVAKPLADQGTCSDSLIVTITATLAEVGAAADTLAATVLLILADQAVGADTLTVSAVAPFTVGALTATDGPAATLTTARSAATLTVADAGGQLAATDVSTATLTALAAAGGPS